MGLVDSREGPLGAVGMISKLFRMECFPDGVSPLAIHALEKWGKIGGPTSWPPEAEHHLEIVVFCLRKSIVLAMFSPSEGWGTWNHILGTNILIEWRHGPRGPKFGTNLLIDFIMKQNWTQFTYRVRIDELGQYPKSLNSKWNEKRCESGSDPPRRRIWSL